MLPLISVIVPVYNVEIYLRQCVYSIINQTYTNLEIILIDDGSTDESGKICDLLKAEDSRIIVIHQANGGLSSARNTGLDIAKGQYYFFIDSDDYMTEDGIQYLYEILMINEGDIAIGGSDEFYDDSENIAVKVPGEESVTCMNRQEALYDVFCNGCAAWSRLYKRKVHENIKFPLGEINEDEAIVVYLYENCQKIVKSNKIVYHYRQRINSITSTVFHKGKLAWYTHTKNNLEYVKQNYPSLVDIATKRYFSSLVWCLGNMVKHKKQFYMDIKKLRNDLKGIFFKLIRNPELEKKSKIKCCIIRYGYPAYSLFICYFSKGYI